MTDASTGAGAKFAVTNRDVSIVAWHDPVPLQSPLHPPKKEPAAGVATNVTTAPGLKSAVHADGQLIAELGEVEVTVPVPPPATSTESVCCAAVVVVKVPATPPIVSVVTVCVETTPAVVWRTQIVLPLKIVPWALVQLSPVQPIE